MPECCDAIVQIEDTKLISEEKGVEKEVEILIEPVKGLDIRYLQKLSRIIWVARHAKSVVVSNSNCN